MFSSAGQKRLVLPNMEDLVIPLLSSGMEDDAPGIQPSKSNESASGSAGAASSSTKPEPSAASFA